MKLSTLGTTGKDYPAGESSVVFQRRYIDPEIYMLYLRNVRSIWLDIRQVLFAFFSNETRNEASIQLS